MKNVTALSFILAVAVSALLLVVPTYKTSTETVESGSGSARRSVTEGYATELEVNGPRVLPVLAFPVLVTLVPVLVPMRAVRAGAALLLGAFCIVAGFSVGLFYVPSAIAMFIAVIQAEPLRKGL